MHDTKCRLIRGRVSSRSQAIQHNAMSAGSLVGAHREGAAADGGDETDAGGCIRQDKFIGARDGGLEVAAVESRVQALRAGAPMLVA